MFRRFNSTFTTIPMPSLFPGTSTSVLRNSKRFQCGSGGGGCGSGGCGKGAGSGGPRQEDINEAARKYAAMKESVGNMRSFVMWSFLGWEILSPTVLLK